MLAETCGARREHATRAAQLCKCDLSTGMVTEYPQLEGVIGKYYAQNIGENEAVSTAIDEHYQPRFSGDRLPDSPVGITLALADKLDTLVGLFSIGHIPTGTKDPFSLRRAALGIVRILTEKEISFELETVIQNSCDLYAGVLDREKSQARLLTFMQERIKSYWLEQSVAFDCIEAVTTVCASNPLDFKHRLNAMVHFVQMPEAENLTVANKRICNILKGQTPVECEFNPGLVKENAEQSLFEALYARTSVMTPLIERALYLEALQELVRLSGNIDAFFDEVLVMSENKSERNNRLALLRLVNNLFMQIADFSKLNLKNLEHTTG